MGKTVRQITRGLAVVSLVGVMAVGATGLRAQAAGDAATYNILFNGTTYAFNVVETNHHGTIGGTVAPPNTSCPGTISGTLSSGNLNITFTFNGSCTGETMVLTGKQRAHSGHGTWSDSRIGTGTWTFTDAVASPAACATGRTSAVSCGR